MICTNCLLLCTVSTYRSGGYTGRYDGGQSEGRTEKLRKRRPAMRLAYGIREAVSKVGYFFDSRPRFTLIRDSIAYGNLEASDAQIVAAARLANADAFIRRLEKGYDTVISGDGFENESTICFANKQMRTQTMS